MGRKFSCLEPQIKDHITHSRIESFESEVNDIKLSLLELQDKVSTVTFILDSFMKEMKGMVVKKVVEEEEVGEQKANEKEEEVNKEGESEIEEEHEQEMKKLRLLPPL